MQSGNIRLAISGALLSAMLGGCAILSVSGSLSPVSGPLAEMTPVPSYPARMEGVLSGHISVTLPGDGSCSGPWSLVGAQQQSFDLAPAWDEVYGSGYHTAHVLGVRQFVRTTLNCNGGNVIRMELANETNTPGSTWGVAGDDHGNVFKVSVYN